MTKKPKIAFFSAFYPPHIGGVERYTSELAKELNSQGAEMLIVTSNTENSPDINIENGIKIIRLPIFTILNGRLPIPKPSFKTFKLIKAYLKEKPDLAIFNMRFYPLSLMGAILSKFNGSKTWLIDHVSSHFDMGSKLMNFLGNSYDHTMTFLIKPFINKFFSVSEACNKWLNHFGIKADGTLYNGISDKYTINKDIEVYLRAQYPSNKKYIFYAARLIKDKGAELLLEAYNRISDELQDTHLIIAGNGPELEYLQSKYLSNPNISLPGALSHDEVMTLLSFSDIVVIPSFYPEGLPTLILEAGISHCAIISTAMGGTKEVIVHNENGMIIPEKNIEAIEKSIAFLFENSHIIEKLADNLEKSVIKTFTWQKIAAKLLDAYTSEK